MRIGRREEQTNKDEKKEKERIIVGEGEIKMDNNRKKERKKIKWEEKGKKTLVKKNMSRREEGIERWMTIGREGNEKERIIVGGRNKDG